LKEALKEAIIEAFKSMLSSAWVWFQHWLIATSFNLALVGGTISVLLYVAGWSKGMRCTGILVVGYTIIRTILS